MGYVNRDVLYDTLVVLQPLALQHRLLPGGFVLNSLYSANSPAASAVNGSDILQKMAEEAVKKKKAQHQAHEKSWSE